MFAIAQQLSCAIGSEAPAHPNASVPISPLQELFSNESIVPDLSPDEIFNFIDPQPALTSTQNQQTFSFDSLTPQSTHPGTNHVRHISSNSTDSINSGNPANFVSDSSARSCFQFPSSHQVAVPPPTPKTNFQDRSKPDYGYQMPSSLAASFQRSAGSTVMSPNWSQFHFGLTASQNSFDGIFGSGTYQQQAFDGSGNDLATEPWNALHLPNSNQGAMMTAFSTFATRSIPAYTSAVSASGNINKLNGDSIVQIAGNVSNNFNTNSVARTLEKADEDQDVQISSIINQNSDGLNAAKQELAYEGAINAAESHFTQPSHKRKRSQERLGAAVISSPVPSL